MSPAAWFGLHRFTLALTVVALFACGGGDDSVSAHAITGHVTQNGQAVSGITVVLTGTTTATKTTNTAGAYTFDGLPDGTYTVTPSHATYPFYPTTLEVAVSGEDVIDQDFAVAEIYAIGGRIFGPDQKPATVTLLPAVQASTQTDVSGMFTFASVPQGDYTVTPSRTGYKFWPESASVFVWDREEDVSFAFAPVDATYTIDFLYGKVVATIGGPEVGYLAMMTNWTGTDATSVAIQSWIEQGTGVRRQAGNELPLSCGYPASSGEFPPGSCRMSGAYYASNQAAGTGTLVAGSATHVMELKVSGSVVFTLRWPLTLANP